MIKSESGEDEPLLDLTKLIHEDCSFKQQQSQPVSSLKLGDGEVPYIRKSKSETARNKYYFISPPPQEQPQSSKTEAGFFDRRRSKEVVDDNLLGVPFFIPLFLLGIVLSLDAEYYI